VKFEAKMI